MKQLTIEQLQKFAEQAEQPLQQQWLEDINPFGVTYYRWLFHICKFVKPQVALELGIARAQASAHMAAGGAKVVIGVDREPWEPEFSIAVEAIRSRNLKFILVLGDTQHPRVVERVRSLVEQLGSVELLFIDSTHTYDQVLGEFQTYKSLLVNGALIVCDDLYTAENDVLRAFLEIPGEHIQLEELHTIHQHEVSKEDRVVGFGAVIYKKED